jgi:ribosomal protein L11 methylase PrmA
LREDPAPEADAIVANLMRPLLLEVASRMERRPDALILSGLLDEEADEVAAAFAPLRERERRSMQGWTALLLL